MFCNTDLMRNRPLSKLYITDIIYSILGTKLSIFGEI